ncbi:hypothetical protein KNO81_42385 [Paraburkholderia sediminicola]|nr:hypothetical protein [Paraburkholderia sediminicola]
MTDTNEPIMDPAPRDPASLSLQALPCRKDEPLVTAIVPRGFKFTLENYELVLIPAGTLALPRHIARHW